MVFGTFDVLHPGHTHMLTEARRYGDYLVVVVARDITVEQVKKRKPIHTQEIRIKNLKNLGLADEVLLGYEDDKHDIVLDVKPDVVALGYDQRFFIDDLEKVLDDKAKIVRLSPYFPEKYKSSKLQPDREV